MCAKKRKVKEEKCVCMRYKSDEDPLVHLVCCTASETMKSYIQCFVAPSNDKKRAQRYITDFD